ncbi:MAG: MurR/RpiR family transcriptional regulator, partial [Paracoccaceae bacterium]
SETQARLQGPLSRYDGMPGPVGQSVNHAVAQAMRQNIEIAEREMSAILPRIVDLLADADRNILCIGGRFSWMIAAYLHQYLRELRQSVGLVRGGSAGWADYLLDVRPRDVVVIFDFRRYQRDVLDFAKGVVTQQAQIILVTDIWYSPIAAFADIVLPVPVSIPSAFDSGVTGLAVVEIIMAGVIEALGAQSRDRISTLESLRKPFNIGS